MPPAEEESTERSAPIPMRRYAAFWSIGVLIVGGTYLAWSLIAALTTVLSLVVVAAFFAIVLTPAVDALEQRLGRGERRRRGIATLAVFILGVIVFGALGYAFARPVYDASTSFSKDLPHTIRDAENGRGEIGKWLKDIGAQKWAHDNLPKIRDSLGDVNGPLLTAGKTVATGVVALLTILILVFLMLVEGPNISAFLLGLLPEQRADRVRRVGSDAARAVTGYMAGNLLISLIAGCAIYIWLRAWFIPFALVLALWVAFADMLPLVGATLGAIPPVFVAFLDSPTAGIATLIFFVVYQQFENHVLQTTIMAKTVKLNPLGVLLAVLIGVELAGLVGALLAIPAAGAIQVVARDVWDQRRGRVKEVLSIGASEEPVS
jgi:predicted PurR-regulated permease PerM